MTLKAAIADMMSKAKPVGDVKTKKPRKKKEEPVEEAPVEEKALVKVKKERTPAQIEAAKKMAEARKKKREEQLRQKVGGVCTKFYFR